MPHPPFLAWRLCRRNVLSPGGTSRTLVALSAAATSGLEHGRLT